LESTPNEMESLRTST